MAGHGRHAVTRPAHRTTHSAPRRLRATTLLPVAAVVAATAGAAAEQSTPVAATTPATTTTTTPATTTQATTAEQVGSAIKASPLTSDVPDSAYTVDGVRTAAQGSWAFAHIVPEVGSLQPADAVLQHTDKGWQLVGLGGTEIGCSVPAPVRGAFDLTCTPASGSGAEAATLVA